MKLYPIKSLTADNGKEFLSLSKIEGLDVYFAQAYSSYERQWTTKRVHSEGASLKELNQNLLEDYKKAINERPRRIHGYQSAKKLVWVNSNSFERYSLNQRNNFVELDLTI